MQEDGGWGGGESEPVDYFYIKTIMT